MLKISAASFVTSVEYIGRMSRIFGDLDNTSLLADDVRVSLKESINEVEPFLDQLRAPATAQSLSSLREVCDEPASLERDAGVACGRVFENFLAEVSHQWLLILSHEHSDYLNDETAPFGEVIWDSLPEFAEDIDEAAKCLALSRYTASVFHLMRIMERSVHKLAQIFKVQLNTKTNSWNDITTALSNALAKMPGQTSAQKKKKAKLADAVAQLTSVRIAWRNEVMHPKRTYTKKEADNIFRYVEGFLQAFVAAV